LKATYSYIAPSTLPRSSQILHLNGGIAFNINYFAHSIKKASIMTMLALKRCIHYASPI